MRPVGGLASVLAGTTYYAHVTGITTYVAAADGQARAIAGVDGALYALDLVSGRTAPLPGLTCIEPAAISPDATRLACLGPTPTSATPYACAYACWGPILQVAALLEGPPPHLGVPTIVQVGAASQAQSALWFASPTWAPDGRHLAVLRRPQNYRPTDTAGAQGVDACAVETYALAADDSQLTLTARLTLTTDDVCAVRQIAWAPDGAALALLSVDTLRLLPRAALPPVAYDGPPDRPPASAHLAPVTLAAGLPKADWMAWRSDAQALAVLAHNTIWQLAVATHALDPLLALPSDVLTPPYSYSRIGAFDWTSDGHGLVFSFGPRELPPYASEDTAIATLLPTATRAATPSPSPGTQQGAPPPIAAMLPATTLVTPLPAPIAAMPRVVDVDTWTTPRGSCGACPPSPSALYLDPLPQ